MSNALKCHACSSTFKNAESKLKEGQKCPSCKGNWLYEYKSRPGEWEVGSPPTALKCYNCGSVLGGRTKLKPRDPCPSCDHKKLFPYDDGREKVQTSSSNETCSHCHKEMSYCSCDRCPYCGTLGNCRCYGPLIGN